MRLIGGLQQRVKLRDKKSRKVGGDGEVGADNISLISPISLISLISPKAAFAWVHQQDGETELVWLLLYASKGSDGCYQLREL